MTYEIYRYIFMGGAALAAIMFVVTVLVFIFLNIPTVIGDLTGANARKAIENIRNQNESTGDKTYRSSHVNRERGRLTDKISPSGRIEKARSDSLHGAMATQKLNTQELSAEAASETTVLTEALSVGGGETTLLSGEGGSANETAVLSELAQSTAAQPAAVEFTVEYEITYIHTDEVIA